MRFAIFWFSATLMVTAALTLIGWTSYISNKAYNEAMIECVKAGASWVHTTGYNGNCIYGRSKEEK